MPPGFDTACMPGCSLGRPDIVFPSRKLAVFVNGCFFHQHPGCPHARMPKSRLDFWVPKLAGNVERDHRQWAELRALGWNVIVVWECETRRPERLAEVMAVIREMTTRPPRPG